MIGRHAQSITYLRLSVTDRCDLRCAYCMPERMEFLPRSEVLSIDELDRLASLFIKMGITKLRLTGGEPLVRKGFTGLIERLSRHFGNGLDELVITTNGTRLAEHAEALARHGVKRINVSIDSLDPATYARITRGGDIAKVIAGVDAAIAAGIKVKLNTVALANDNLEEVVALADWAHQRGAAISFIEVMPLGDVEAERIDQHVPMTEVRRRLAERWSLTPLTLNTGGPARYVRTEAGGTIGFITPLSDNFCGSCNRVRVTCTGQLYLCLGHDAKTDLRGLLRSGDEDALRARIAGAMRHKPLAHDFMIAPKMVQGVKRHMSVTGG
ncbi:GTP 3',8-cyclase MoaA [Sphingomonas sp.]|uniref:GTP 3',8-cyclase MoaA n=1 Tax=Sphingomonas sp. TaxID=28214 RepID=UPI00286C02F1|nr:GTP 3',8-cyclase MoaA [Sphingomonas sp.]